MRMARAYDKEDHPLSERGIEQQNEMLLRRYREFRRGADAVAAAWRAHPEVIAVSLIGSVARDPWKEVPRFGPYRRARVALWHECKDVDLALWLEHLDSLDGLRRAKARALRTLWDEASIGIASHQVDVFILEPGTDRYLGRLRDFNTCPKGKAECRVRGLRRGDAAASARGVQVASGEPGRGPCGPAVRTRDGTAAPCERSATSRGRCWVTGCRTEWRSVSPPSHPGNRPIGPVFRSMMVSTAAERRPHSAREWADDEVGVDPPHCAQATPARRA